MRNDKQYSEIWVPGKDYKNVELSRTFTTSRKVAYSKHPKKIACSIPLAISNPSEPASASKTDVVRRKPTGLEQPWPETERMFEPCPAEGETESEERFVDTVPVAADISHTPKVGQQKNDN